MGPGTLSEGFPNRFERVPEHAPRCPGRPPFVGVGKPPPSRLKPGAGKAAASLAGSEGGPPSWPPFLCVGKPPPWIDTGDSTRPASGARLSLVSGAAKGSRLAPWHARSFTSLDRSPSVSWLQASADTLATTGLAAASGGAFRRSRQDGSLQTPPVPCQR